MSRAFRGKIVQGPANLPVLRNPKAFYVLLAVLAVGSHA
jgi:hypothetical protein